MSDFKINPLLIASSISNLFLASDSGLLTWTINPYNDNTEVNKATLIDSHVSLWDLKRASENGQLERRLILTTYLKKIDSKKPYFMAVHQHKEAYLCTEISVVDWDKETAVNRCFEASEQAKQVVEKQKKLIQPDGSCLVDEIFVNNQEYIGIERFSEQSFYAYWRNIYTVNYIN